MDANPFTFWQQFWQTASPQAAAFLPPMTLEEVNRKIGELRNVEVWLNFNLQAVRTQISILEQQAIFFSSLKKRENNDAPTENADEENTADNQNNQDDKNDKEQS